MAQFRPVLRLSRGLLAKIAAPQTPKTRNIKRWVAPTLQELHRRREKIGVPEPKPRSTFLEWNYEAEVFAFGKRLGEDFDRQVLKQALTHKSYVNLEVDKAKENGVQFEALPHNTELITVGESLISDYIRAEFSKIYPEELVQVVHDYLTSEEIQAHVAKHMGAADIVLTPEFPVGKDTLAATFKALVAALDPKRSPQFIKDFLFVYLEGKDVYELWNLEKPYDYLVTLLQEKGVAIEPRLCNQSATNTILANYQVGVYNSNKELLGIGWGESIAVAKDTAALSALQRLHRK